MTPTATRKLMVLVHPRGDVRRIVCDELPSLLPARVGAPLSQLIQAQCIPRFERFLRAVATRSAAFDWELNVQTSVGTLLMHFAGLRLGSDELLVSAAQEPVAMIRQLESFLAPQRPRSSQEPVVPLDTGTSLDGVSRVNNELVNLQRELAKRNVELEAITRERNELLAMAAHDLRTPISVVKGYCQLLLTQLGGTLGAQKQTMVERVGEATDYALELLTQTLEYARAKEAGPTLTLAETDLGELVAQTLTLHRGLASAKHIELVPHVLPPAPPPLMVDAHKLQRALGNLLTNAIKYSPEGTQVDIVLQRVGDYASLCVADHGLGIAQDELPGLFQPFHTTSTRPTKGESSTGLGLAIARQLVEAHGGDISVSSVRGQGSAFTVRLPIAAPERQTQPRIHMVQSDDETPMLSAGRNRT